MWRARRWKALAVAVGAGVMLSGACTTLVVVGERHRDSADPGVIRVAEERGFGDTLDVRLSPPVRPVRRIPTPQQPPRVRIGVPLEVRAGADSVVLTGCALRPFRLRPFSGPDFPLDSLVRDPDLLLVPVGDSVVRPGERRLVVVRLVKAASDPETEAFGIRIDERRAMLDSLGPCPPLSSAGDSIQHIAFRRREVEPLGPMVGAGVLVLFSLVVLGR